MWSATRCGIWRTFSEPAKSWSTTNGSEPLRGTRLVWRARWANSSLSPVTAQVTCAYSIAPQDRRGVGGSIQMAESPHDAAFHESRVVLDLERPRVEFDRRAPEYLGGMHPIAEYEVSSAQVLVNTYDHLPRVALVRFGLSAPGIDGVVQAIKDLYDPATDVSLDGRLIGALVGSGDRVAGRHRGAVAYPTSPVPSSDDPGVQAIAMQLLAKDLAVDFDAERSSLEAPDDLNGPIGAEIWTWAESTLIWRLPARLSGWFSDIETNTALGVSLRQLCDDASRTVQAEQDSDGRGLAQRIRDLGALRTAFNRATAGEIDGHMVRCGLQQRAHLDAFLRHSGADRARERVEAMFDQHLGALQLEERLRSRAGARDLANVVRVFAAVTIALTVLSVGQAVVQGDGNGRLGSAIAAGAIILLVTTAVGVLLAAASQFDVGRRRGLAWTVAAAAVLAGSIALVADAHSSLGGGRWTTWLGLVLVIGGAIGVSFLARLGDRS